ncbi:MAG TPA: hypothetical protein VFQ44_21795 [Streptosporangiaceae bacterium]|nr:hypothetical protein [Streptosporangiaceae bacterium]
MGERTLAAYAAGITTGLAVGVLAASYHLAWQHRIATWGATDGEAAAHLPGDELCPDPDFITTRAIAISAPPNLVWPWLVQMGSGRAGRYSYDWIENLFGLDMHSADVLLPQFQDLSPGDKFPCGRRDSVVRVEALDPEKRLTFGVFDGRWISSFALFPQRDSTRLICRHRVALPQSSAISRLLLTLLMEPISLLFDHRMLLGIKERAERLARGRDFADDFPWRADTYVWSGEHL